MAKHLSFSPTHSKPKPYCFSMAALSRSSIKADRSNHNNYYFRPLSLTLTIPQDAPSRQYLSVKSTKHRGLQAHHRRLTPTCSAAAEVVVEQPEGSDKNDQEEEEKSPATWIDLYLPEFAQPYAYLLRLHNLFLPWLLCWPYFWSIALAAEPGKLLDVKMLGLFLVIVFVERNTMMTVNDLFDWDTDSKIKRTKTRPIAAGSITIFQAVCFCGAQLLLNYGLYHQVNNLSRTLWILSVPLSFLYPITKRLTHLSQAYFSMTVHWGALIGWAAVRGSLDPPNVLLPLYFSGFFWTLLYETIYASQDKEADAKLGLKSTAILFGDSIKIWLTGFGVAIISGLTLLGFNAHIGWPYYASLVPASFQLAWQILTVDLSNPADCKIKQKSNKWLGAIIFLGIVLGKLLS